MSVLKVHVCRITVEAKESGLSFQCPVNLGVKATLWGPERFPAKESLKNYFANR